MQIRYTQTIKKKMMLIRNRSRRWSVASGGQTDTQTCAGHITLALKTQKEMLCTANAHRTSRN